MALLILTARPDRPRGGESPAAVLQNSREGAYQNLLTSSFKSTPLGSLGVDGCVFPDPRTTFQVIFSQLRKHHKTPDSYTYNGSVYFTELL